MTRCAALALVQVVHAAVWARSLTDQWMLTNASGELRTARNPHGSVPMDTPAIRLTNVVQSPQPACCENPTGLDPTSSAGE